MMLTAPTVGLEIDRIYTTVYTFFMGRSCAFLESSIFARNYVGDSTGTFG